MIIWYHNSTVIRETSDVKITFDGSVARLSISKCKISQSGTYKVIARNDFGEDESSATLTVTEKKEEKKKEEEKKEEEKVSTNFVMSMCCLVNVLFCPTY